jgi:hypothetical protein
MLSTIGGLLAILGFAQAVAPAPIPIGEEAAVPFVRSDGVQDWQADGDRGLFIQGINGRWYYARTLGRCGRLATAVSLGFETRGLDELDRHGAIIAEGWRCALSSVTRSAKPPLRSAN